MSGLTKEQLRNELVIHGVELPSSGAKKDEYVRLYEKYVAPVEESKGDFSSDDEDLPVNDVDTQASLETSMVIDGLDISKLDDDELFSRLKDLGASVGPIVDTTRMVYEKRLFTLLGGEVIDSPSYNGDVGEEEYSDSDNEVIVKPRESRSSYVVESRKTIQTMKSPPFSDTMDIRKRILISPGEKSTQSSVVFDPERHTPSPRRSLRTVTSDSSETVTVHRFMNNSSMSGNFREEFDSRHVGDTNATTSTSTDSSTSKASVYLRLLIKLLFLILIIAVVLYFYQSNHSESPFKAVEQLARQALEAAVGEEAAFDGEEGLAEPDVPPAEEEVPLESQ